MTREELRAVMAKLDAEALLPRSGSSTSRQSPRRSRCPRHLPASKARACLHSACHGTTERQLSQGRSALMSSVITTPGRPHEDWGEDGSDRKDTAATLA
jgi:hypothetical protein